MTLQNSNGFITHLSNAVGTSEPALRLLLAILAGYPLAIVYRRFIYNKAATVQHFYFIVTGFLLGYSNYGFDTFHAIFAITFTYTTLAILGGSQKSVATVFIGNMLYLLTGYYCVGTDNYDINWTMPQCVLVLRLIGVAFDLYDGQRPLDSLGTENKKVMIEKCPCPLAFFGYMLFPASFMVGPQFAFRRYQDFVAGKFGGADGAPPNSERAGWSRGAIGLVYLTIFQVLGIFVSDDYIISDEYANLSFLRRLVLIGIWGRYSLYKYISCWLLTEGACTLFGVSYSGKKETGVEKWDGVQNVKLSLFEATTEFNHYIQSFNINTNHWVAQYVYKRLKFLGNRHYSQVAALFFLAVWHGFHSGYYLCFVFEYLVIYMERDAKAIVAHNPVLSAFFARPPVKVGLHLLLRLYTFIFMGWCLLPFVLLKFPRYWTAFSSLNHVGTLLFVVWPIVYSPILRKIFVTKRKSATTTTTTNNSNTAITTADGSTEDRKLD